MNSHAHSSVALIKCSSYTANIQEKLEKLLSELGGIKAFVQPGQSALIKPNMLTDRTPDQAVTTHPELIRAIIRIVKNHGGNPSVADSPASIAKVEHVWKKSGIKAVCDEENVPMIILEKAGSVKFNRDNCSFNIAKPILDADVIINVPKVKTHILTILTAAVKNMYGVVPGYQKTTLHKLYPTPQNFGKLIAAIYKTVPPQLNIADAVIGMDGDGPSAGSPIQLGFLAASGNAVAMDLILCSILKINPRTVPYLRYLVPTDNYTLHTNEISVIGEKPEKITPRSFNCPSTLMGRLIPGRLVELIQPLLWIRPSISDACVQCGRCVEACPSDALSQQKNKTPVLDGKKCIGCCCCHEICPEKAISMKQSALLNLIRKGKMP
ncbi:DUF362 domain-containing protein [Verrucomicrobiota bacterium]